MRNHLMPVNLQRPIMHRLLGIVALVLIVTGCANGTYVGQNATASVYLEEVTDWSFDASHPVVIDQLTIAKAIKGLYRTDRQSGPSRIPVGGSDPTRVFSDEDAESMTPMLAQGLSWARPDQLVGFRVSSSPGSDTALTVGSIYVRNGSIYLTISKGNKPTGFAPESAAHTEKAPAYATRDALGAMSMVIDYRALNATSIPADGPTAKAVPISPMPSMPTAAPAKAQAISHKMSQGAEESGAMTHTRREWDNVHEELARKDSEIVMLRKESEWMKRELRERDEAIKSIKKMTVSTKPAPKKKPAEATRMR